MHLQIFYCLFRFMKNKLRFLFSWTKNVNNLTMCLKKNRASIEEYKKLKQAVITQAVINGIRGNREMKDSGVEWNNKIPVEWDSINPKALFGKEKRKHLRAKNS